MMIEIIQGIFYDTEKPYEEQESEVIQIIDEIRQQEPHTEYNGIRPVTMTYTHGNIQVVVAFKYLHPNSNSFALKGESITVKEI